MLVLYRSLFTISLGVNFLFYNNTFYYNSLACEIVKSWNYWPRNNCADVDVLKKWYFYRFVEILRVTLDYWNNVIFVSFPRQLGVYWPKGNTILSNKRYSSDAFFFIPLNTQCENVSRNDFCFNFRFVFCLCFITKTLLQVLLWNHPYSR